MKTNFINDGPPPQTNAYHQFRSEPEYILRARSARAMLRALEDEGADMETPTKKKVEKALLVELRNAMDEAREAYLEGQATIGKTP